MFSQLTMFHGLSFVCIHSLCINTLRKYDNHEPKTNRQKQLIVIVFLKYYVINNKIILYKGERLIYYMVAFKGPSDVNTTYDG